MSPATTHAASRVEDFDEISQVMKTLLEGEAAGDVAKLKSVFHPDARMFGQAEGQRYDLSISEYYAFAASAPANSEGNYRARVLSVQQTGDVAIVVAVEENCWGGGSKSGSSASATASSAKRRASSKRAAPQALLPAQLSSTHRRR
jgi:hypothetical protein